MRTVVYSMTARDQLLDLREPVHRVEAVEVALGKGLQAQAGGLQDGQGTLQ